MSLTVAVYGYTRLFASPTDTNLQRSCGGNLPSDLISDDFAGILWRHYREVSELSRRIWRLSRFFTVTDKWNALIYGFCFARGLIEEDWLIRRRDTTTAVWVSGFSPLSLAGASQQKTVQWKNVLALIVYSSLSAFSCVLFFFFTFWVFDFSHARFYTF